MKWLLLLIAAAPALAQCTYTVSIAGTYATPQSGFNVPSTAVASAQINVSTATNCAWSFATDSPSWISFLGAVPDSSGHYPAQFGPGVVTFAVSASTLPVPRQAIIQIGGNNFVTNITINQAAANCAMTLSPPAATMVVAGGTSAFTVQTGCTWVAQSQSSWITLASTATYTGTGGVNYTAPANPCVASRTGFISVYSQPVQVFTLTQSGSDSNLTVTPASLNPPVAGTAGAFSVLTGPGCGWTAYSDVNFIHFTSPSTGSGVGSLGYSIDANTGVARSGNVHFGNLVIPVTQPAAAGATTAISAVRNAATPAAVPTAFAPGEIVSLFGTAMGPTTGLVGQVSGGAFPTNLGGTQVFFDGTPAPLLYASATQINTVVPYGAAGKASTQLTVQYNGATSPAITLPVAATAPAIFTQDGSGSGIGAILNQDYSLNGRLTPAARGSVVAIYLTGAGGTTPASSDGAVIGATPPFPALAQSTTVTVGGVTVPASQVLYSGAAPGSIAGLTQIDIVIPQSVTPNLTTPLTITIGGVSTQAGITLAVQ